MRKLIFNLVWMGVLFACSAPQKPPSDLDRFIGALNQISLAQEGQNLALTNSDLKAFEKSLQAFDKALGEFEPIINKFLETHSVSAFKTTMFEEKGGIPELETPFQRFHQSSRKFHPRGQGVSLPEDLTLRWEALRAKQAQIFVEAMMRGDYIASQAQKKSEGIPEGTLEAGTAAWRKVLPEDGLILREGPNQSFNALTVIPKLEKVAAYETSGDMTEIGGVKGIWTRVQWRGFNGWVFGGYLKPLE